MSETIPTGRPMGFVYDLGKMACRPPSQKSSDAVSQYFVAVYRRIRRLGFLALSGPTHMTSLSYR